MDAIVRSQNTLIRDGRNEIREQGFLGLKGEIESREVSSGMWLLQYA